jgi:hypothetical protein
MEIGITMSPDSGNLAYGPNASAASEGVMTKKS